MKKFSIIIPIYNVDKYLKKCIESILKQTFKEYEMILVNDGSTDSSKMICDEYSTNSNVSVIHKKNGGLSDARNKGIEKINGEYTLFMDSDDYIDDENFLMKLSNIIDKKNPELILYGYRKVYEENEKIIFEKKESKSKSLYEMIMNNEFKACAWDKVIKSTIIKENDLKFTKNRLSEDIEWCSKLIKLINLSKIEVLNENPYCYLQRKNSITKVISDKHMMDVITSIRNEKIYNEDERKELVNSFLAYEYSCSLGIINSNKINKESRKSILDEFYKEKDILKFDINRKVKKIKKVTEFLGIKLTGKLLGLYLNLR